MADFSDDLLSSKPSDRSKEAFGSEDEKIHVRVHDETKDQLPAESSIPLSPQWLYSKPSETKDMRTITSVTLGNANDANQKESRRLDGTDEKRDWRRIATENETSHCWREEERETGLLGPRRDRRKTERRAENVTIRETLENRVLPSPDRWHEGSNRNLGHEARRDSKWSSRWGPDDKEKEPRIEKRTDVEKDKEDAYNDIQSSIGNRSAIERESDSRDKWRPRHRMEVHSAGSTSYRAAPGFVNERGRGEGSNMGFGLGRGRSNAIGRGLTPGSSAVSQLYRNESVIGKPYLTIDTFCYPRGKLLDIYRQHKLGSLFAAIPEEMKESLPLTQGGVIQPLAFVAPDAEEEAILTGIWKGNIMSSGLGYHSFGKGRSEIGSGNGEYDSIEDKVGFLPSEPFEGTGDPFQDAPSNGAYQTDDNHSLWNHDLHLTTLNEQEMNEEGNKVPADEVTSTISGSDGVVNMKEISTSFHSDSQLFFGEKGQMMGSALARQFGYDDLESASFVNGKSKLPDDSNSPFVLPSPGQDHGANVSQLASNNDAKDLEKRIPPEDLYFYYIDPHGMTQGPFLGADIMLWFEEGYFGTDLPIRLANAAEGTPFRSVGEVMPCLRTGNDCSNSELLELTGTLGRKVEPSLPDTTVPENMDLPTVINPCQPLPNFASLSNQNAQPRIPELDNTLESSQSEGQILRDFAAHDAVFPGRPGSNGCPTTLPPGNAPDSLANSTDMQLCPTKFAESCLPHQRENSLHPFGLFWSELEISQAKQTESSDFPSSVGKSATCGATSDPASFSGKRADVYRKNITSVPNPNSCQDATAAHFDLAELMSQKVQQQQLQQLQQRNMLSSHLHLNESPLKPVPGQNLVQHQQLGNRPLPDLEHLLSFQMQHQRLQQQLQLQLQQQQFQQQQQQQKQQKLLQERQEAQAQQVLLEQLLNSRMIDPNLSRSHTSLDQVLLEQQLLHELQQQSHHQQRHFVPSMELLARAKFGQTIQQDPQRDMLELLSRAQHGQMQSLEHQILQEQLQVRQVSMGLRQQMNVEEDRHTDPLWPVNGSDSLLGSLAVNPRAHSSINPVDIYEQQQRTPLEDQFSHVEGNLSFQDQLQQRIYEPGSVSFKRSLSSSAGAPVMNMDMVNAMAHARSLDRQELSSRMQSTGDLGMLTSGSHSHNSRNHLIPSQFHVSPLDGIGGHWPESSGHLVHDRLESQMEQMHINAEQRREPDAKTISENSGSWMSDRLNEDKSRQLLMELLHQKSGPKSADTLQPHDGLCFDKRLPSGLYTGSSSSDDSFSVVSDQEAVVNSSFALGSCASNACELADVSSAGEHVGNLTNAEKLPFWSMFGAEYDRHSSLLPSSETPKAFPSDPNVVDKLPATQGHLDVKERKHGAKILGVTNFPVSGTPNCIAEHAPLAATDHGEVPVDALSGHHYPGFNDCKIGLQTSFAEDIAMNQVPVLSKEQEDISLRRPPVGRVSSSQEGLSELVSDTAVRGKGNQSTDVTSGKKDVRFRRTSSCEDGDGSEPSFIDMLKSNAKKTAVPELHTTATGSELSEGTQGGRSGKKKGKKGRQIDPALLGFKVTSNRIMMGEIQRIDD